MNSGLYKLLLLCHLLTVIVGFGSVVLNGVYGAESKNRQGPTGLAVLQANKRVSLLAEKLIYLVPVFGILLVLDSDKALKFSQTWIWLSLVLYVVGIGVSHGVMIPAVNKMEAAAEELNAMGPPPQGASPSGPPPQVAVMEELGKRLAAGGMFLNLLLVVIVALMVWKPGFP
ncbi:MAG: DUF2269 family protein [Actinobacteria bacterium]|nr:DUF2269 family protein [Actinomycetota bacterium]MBV8959105.1 DUF2269 family protein [Actinomycetota bacterium]MBV9255895.1 DUF2269 family protein [Actinomycetota bacterium]MBV9665466.1 DUF2269 family protein [Actinomycetota bacterium]MBV9935681.1 DUF2269 family protein [Actinomycetota bacterium]